VLFEQPEKRPEALQMLDRARRLDPLEPAHDVTKAVFLLYDRGDVDGAEALLRNVLQRRPDYPPALTRLGELDWCCRSDTSEAIELLERVVALDPQAQWPRRLLVRAYLDVDDPEAAEAVIAQWSGEKEILSLPVLAYRGDWRRAGELAYAAVEQGQIVATDEIVATVALRRHARLTGQYERASDALANLSGVTWSADGTVVVPPRSGLRVAELGLADLLQASGRTLPARRLLDEVVRQMRAELESPGRTATWYWRSMGVAYALRGEPAVALDWLAQGERTRGLVTDRWLVLAAEPAFDGLRPWPAFAAMAQRAGEVARRERGELDALRAEGRLPGRR
jgi:tetratricopeptide (TPR) repeat protein